MYKLVVLSSALKIKLIFINSFDSVTLPDDCFVLGYFTPVNNFRYFKDTICLSEENILKRSINFAKYVDFNNCRKKNSIFIIDDHIRLPKMESAPNDVPGVEPKRK